MFFRVIVSPVNKQHNRRSVTVFPAFLRSTPLMDSEFGLETPDVESPQVHKTDYKLKNGKTLANLWKLGSIIKKPKNMSAFKYRANTIACIFSGDQDAWTAVIKLLPPQSDLPLPGFFKSPVSNIRYKVVTARMALPANVQIFRIKCLPKADPKLFYEEAFNIPKQLKSMSKFKDYDRKPPVLLIGIESSHEPQTKRRKTDSASLIVLSPEVKNATPLFSLPTEVTTIILQQLPRPEIAKVQQTCKYLHSVVATKGLISESITDEEAVEIMHQCKAEAYCSIDINDPDSIAALLYALPIPQKY